MIYLTGDTHGGMERFQSKEAKQLKKGDTLIICGDFGFIWDGPKGKRNTSNGWASAGIPSPLWRVPTTTWTGWPPTRKRSGTAEKSTGFPATSSI